MDQIWTDILAFCQTIGLKLVCALAVLLVGFKLIKMLSRYIGKSKLSEKLDPSVSGFIRNIIILVLRISVVVTVCIILGIPATSFITILASAGVTVGLALQGSLSNLAGGLMIMFFRPYSVGDSIRALNMEGTVREISAFYTILVTRDNSRVILPNGQLTNSGIINYTAEKIRRIDATLTFDLSCDVAETIRRIESAVYAREDLLKEPAAEVKITQQTAANRTYTVYAWCSAEDYDEIKPSFATELYMSVSGERLE